MLTSMRIIVVAATALVSGAALSDSIEALSISSDVWLRDGPSTSNRRITGLPRGTAVMEIADLDTMSARHSDRWVQVYVLEGRAAGREGWVWGSYVNCCEAHEWMQ
ncbi:SH3 domain-containing protein [Acuticoccus kandeliae]|uniref:SH3 domain-containing protein n=1 Tax=Acuticoccus kandeliae TaxID=2073160 RepID=UPI000D3E958F|nr:SH3 domain-containing protein [Acuticoccus kandeliae]